MTSSLPATDAGRPRPAAGTADVGLWEWDLRTNKVHFSPEWKRQIGYAEHELANAFNEWQSRIHPEDLPQTLRAVQAYLAHPADGYQAEFRLRHKNGSYRWIQAHGANAGTDRGKPIRLLAAHLDITERKRLDEDLRQAAATAFLRHDQRARREALIIAGLCVVVGLAAYYFEVLARVSGWVLQFGRTPLDAFIVTLVFLPFALVVHAFRRRRELEQEVAERGRTEAALRALEAELETRVEQRTIELSQANAALQAAVARPNPGARFTADQDGYRELVGRSPAGIFIESDSRFVYANDAFCRIVGASSPEQLLGTSVFERFSPELHQTMRERIAQMLETGEAAPLTDLQYVRLDGSPVDVETTSAPATFQGRLAIQVMVNETTRRKQVEAERGLLGSALSSAANEVVITSRDGNIRWVNPAFTKSTGYTLAEAYGRNPREFLKSGRHEPAFFRNLWSTLVRGEAWRGEMTNRRKDQSLFTVAATITPVKDQHGAITHFIAIQQANTAPETPETPSPATATPTVSPGQSMAVFKARPAPGNVPATAGYGEAGDTTARIPLTWKCTPREADRAADPVATP